MIDRKIHSLSRLFLILFAATAALLFYWQVIDANYLVNRPENQRLYAAQAPEGSARQLQGRNDMALESSQETTDSPVLSSAMEES